jgi:hypothetical protein
MEARPVLMGHIKPDPSDVTAEPTILYDSGQPLDSDPVPHAPNRPIKLTVNVSRETYNALKDMAAGRGVTLTEMLRQAISTAKWVQETTAQGEKILKQDRAGHLFEVVFR